jgi:septum formation protein
MKIILASSSPRRDEILNIGGIEHQIIPSFGEEIKNLKLSKEKMVEDISLQKAKKIYDLHPNEAVLGADTLVFYQNEILGKPKDIQDAKRMLRLLSGKTHEVITGVTLMYHNQVDSFHCVTKVCFLEMTDEEIDEYIAKENVLDKAGAYAIQGFAGRYIEKIDGNYFNVVGLPLSMVYTHLKNLEKRE